MDCTMDLFESAKVFFDKRPPVSVRLLIANKWRDRGFGAVSGRVADVRQAL